MNNAAAYAARFEVRSLTSTLAAAAVTQLWTAAQYIAAGERLAALLPLIPSGPMKAKATLVAALATTIWPAAAAA